MRVAKPQHSILLLTIFYSVTAQTPPLLNCTTDEKPNENFPSLNDSLLEGAQIFKSSQNLTIGQNCDSKNLFNITNDADGSLVTLSVPVTSFCVAKIQCRFECGKGGSILVDKNIKRDQKYNATFIKTYSAQVRELTPVNSSLMLNEALSCQIQGCSGSTNFSTYSRLYTVNQNKSAVPFRMKAQTNTDTLQITGPIDFEKDRSYTVYVTVELKQVQGIPLLLNGQPFATINVSVIDVDDNDPRFNITPTESYHLLIPENNNSFINVPLETTPKIHAYDPDFGINEKILFEVIDQPESGLFNITEDGRITVSKALDYETKNSYRVLIQAAQKDNPTSSTAVASLIVEVIDADDHHPEFLQPEYRCSSLEHVVAGTVVCRVEAVDNDTLPENRNFTYVITSAQSIVTVDNLGQIIVNNSTAFDRESIPNGTLVLQVGTSDGKLGGNTTVQISLVDINDNNPEFTEPEYFFSLGSVPVGQEVGKVEANDRDDGNNGRVNFTVLPYSVCEADSPTARPFSVNSTNGAIVLDNVAFCESYDFFVQACDLAVNSRCSLANVHIQQNATSEVKDIQQNLNVREEMPPNTYIALLKCRGVGYTYNLSGASDYFGVEENSSMLVTKATLDREEINTFNFVVQVSRKNKQLICVVNVTVSVLDVNDNAPHFLQASYHFTLPEHLDIGRSIGTVQATDDDEYEHGNVSYHFGNERAHKYAIDESTGEITVKEASTDLDIVHLVVVAEDGGTPVLRDSADVYITGYSSKANTVPISTPYSVQQIEDNKAKLIRSISEKLNLTVTFDSVIDTTPPHKSKIFLAAPGVPELSFVTTVFDHYEDVRSLFYQSEQLADTASHNDPALGAPEIALVVMAGVILIGTALAIIIFYRQSNSHKRYRQLLETLTKGSSLYESQEIKVDLEDEKADGQDKVQNKDLTAADTPSLAVTAVNPAYTSDTVLNTANVSSVPNETPDYENTEVKQALDQLTASYKQEDVTIDSKKETVSEKVDVMPGKGKHDYENTNIVYAQVEMQHRDSNQNDGCEQNVVNENGKRADLIHFDDTDYETVTNNAGHEETVEVNDALEEPNPDYDIKQVRFHSEVLDADENKIEPLKNKGEEPSTEDKSELASRNQNVETEEQDIVHKSTCEADVTDDKEENTIDEEITEQQEQVDGAPENGMSTIERVNGTSFFGDMESTHF